MDFSARVLGTGVATQLRERISKPVLSIGSDHFTRSSLAHVDCFNYIAASNLTTILSKELRVKNTRDLFENVSPTALALPRLGVIALAVLGAAFEAKGIGGSNPLEAWLMKHLEGDKPIRTFDTIKHREAAEAAKERAERKKRKSQRRDKAQAIRVERFEEGTAS